MGAIIAILLLIGLAQWLKSSYIKNQPQLNRRYNWGVFFRILGTVGYIVYARFFSGGGVDAWIYDNWAANFAEYFRAFDFSPFYVESMWRNGQLFYTNFVAYPAAFFMIFTFDNEFGIYLLFSAVCFAGLVLLFKAFRKNYFFLDQANLLFWVLLFPALWFWTSTIGKDAFMFLGMGVVCMGIHNKRLNYIYIIVGLAILYAFRPPTAYVAVLALSSFFILNIKDNWLIRIFKITAGIVVIILLANYLSDQWGVEEFSNQELTELQSGTLRNNEYGTGVLDEKAGGIGSIPQGIVDVLARPFLWEIRNVLTAAAAIEINAVLLLLIIKRKSFMRFVKDSLSHRLSTFVLAFVFIYVVTVGLFENNIGLIARHRSIIFPFLFLMAFAYDDKVKRAYQQFMWRKRKQAVEKLTAETLRRKEAQINN
ncbi:hypothetical protein [uncultured Marivirga sp.]|uniref:hypothetical protein n=1 Tax=uncultured Marivirga sp. TaxID=1123707 RepID=UPI0030ECD6B8|tara:strand:+ start:133220 stop:134491 length:1272 start_codon:yes stop_codon:yes gene_type:complete